ncbi:MAG: hypothetical protein M3R29_04795, partial [Verrucomicrobiota bacterium]|nr:hypothetical protein [Verrucomicrobiota bacterium]
DPVPPGAVDPILAYPRSTDVNYPIAGRTVVGGYVYRGKQIPALQGTYVFGDYLGPNSGSPQIFTLNYDGGAAASNVQNIKAQLFPTVDSTPVNLVNPSSFGEDTNGEIYITDISAGRVYKIVPTTPNVKIDAITRVPGNTHLTGVGVPFTNVTLKSTTDLSQAFVFLATVPVAGDGTFQFDDASPGPTGFYRVFYP